MTTKLVDIEVTGIREIERKLQASILLDPALERARDTFVSRIVDRPGKGLGATRNQLSTRMESLGARITTTLHNPRQVGSAWQRKNQQLANAMAPRVIDAAISDIESRWAKG